MSCGVLGGFDEPPVWDQVERWNWLGGQTEPTKEFEQPAVELPSGVRNVLNVHISQMGTQTTLRRCGPYVAGMVERVCGFRGADHWQKNKQSIPKFFSRFYKSGEGVGWYSLTTARVAALRRGLTQLDVEVSDLDEKEFETTTLFRLGELEFARPPDAHRIPCHPVLLSVQRRLEGVLSVGRGWGYGEQWICIARRFVDDADLRAGRIPATRVDDETLTASLPVRETIMLALHRVYQDRERYCVTDVLEFHPKDGSVVALHKVLSAALGPTLLTFARVELHALNHTLLGRYR